METLIALGSISAFSLYLFFLARYTIEYVNEQFPMRHMIDDAIMDINDALTSASIIVLVVTVGKYFEEKVKQKIAKMTDEIFPESTLFENMKMNFVEIKNRQLKIDREKVYDVSLIEKGDIIKIVPGVVLVDAILISGAVRAMQSARTGCEDIV
jgi:cation transport ATPase